MDTAKLVETIVGHGVLGVLLVLAVIALWRKDQELAAARKEGADALECDTRLTADGVLVCVHDRRIDREFGYPIPYRCLYSVNVENMFMAGRNITKSDSGACGVNLSKVIELPVRNSASSMPHQAW